MAMKTYDVVREHEGDKFYKRGDTRELDETVAGHLVPHVLRPAGSDDGLRDDGPTVAEYFAAGYDPANYPPHGYQSRSTPEEIAQAIADHKAEGKPKNKAEGAPPNSKAGGGDGK